MADFSSFGKYVTKASACLAYENRVPDSSRVLPFQGSSFLRVQAFLGVEWRVYFPAIVVHPPSSEYCRSGVSLESSAFKSRVRSRRTTCF